MSAAGDIVRAHIPSITRAVESRAVVEDADAWDMDGTYVGPMRDCACGRPVDGFYAYADHLAALLDAMPDPVADVRAILYRDGPDTQWDAEIVDDIARAVAQE